MIDNKELIQSLENLLELELSKNVVPYHKGNSLRMGQYAIRKKGNFNYKIFDVKKNKIIHETFSKSGAVAYVRTLIKNTNARNDVVEIDKLIEKHYIDCLFYKNTMNKSKDDFRKEIARTRFDIAKQQVIDAKHKLERYIF